MKVVNIKRVSNAKHNISFYVIDFHMLDTSEMCLYVEQVKMPNYR